MFINELYFRIVNVNRAEFFGYEKKAFGLVGFCTSDQSLSLVPGGTVCTSPRWKRSLSSV